MRKVIALLTVFVVLVALGISGCSFGIAQAPTATPAPTRTPKPTFTPLVTEKPAPEAPATATNTPVVVPTDTPTPAPSPTATSMATNTPIPPPAPTSPPPPPTATPIPTPTHTPVPVLPCSYVAGSKTGSPAGKPGEGMSSVFSGSVIDAAGNGLNGYGVYFEHQNLGTACVVTGDPTEYWEPGAWKIEFWAPAGPDLPYYLTIKESCAPGARALSVREDFIYKTWYSGKHENITFRCDF